MNQGVFAFLLAAGCAGIVLSFARARSRAVLTQDGLDEPGRRAAVLTLLGAVLLLTVALPFAGGLAGGKPDTRHLTLVSLFGVHVVLALFLACYYLLSRRRPLSDFLKVRSERPVADFSSGVLVGFAGWLVTVVALVVVAGLLWAARRPGIESAGREVPSTILWMASRPLWVRIAIVVSAMIVEELFFRSFLQTRVGPLAATLMFTAAHGVYGQPMVLVGILVISTVLSVTFALYGNVLPCIAAHGTFDAIQMFVLIPLAVGR
jgi:membrane protease YdiL (CAAX protease family)